MSQGIDRHQAIGVGLIFVLLMLYFFYFAPTTSQKAPEATSDSVVAEKNSSPISKRTTSVSSASVLSADSLAPRRKITVETEDFIATFDSQGARLTHLSLKHYQKYGGGTLALLDSIRSSWRHYFSYQGERVSCEKLYFSVDTNRERFILSEEDTLRLNFRLTLDQGHQLHATYHIAGKGYRIAYTLSGLETYADASQVTLEWEHYTIPIEKNLSDLRTRTTLVYYSEEDGLEEIEILEMGQQEEVQLRSDVRWLGVKEKFFTQAIIPHNPLIEGEALLKDLGEDRYIKSSVVRLHFSLASQKTLRYNLYVGPNESKALAGTAEGFEENVYLGWGILGWINQALSVSIFYALLDYTNNYGLIIFVLVLAIRLILSPLTYRSYIGMAKMRVLKPEIDEIKKAYPNDMRKQQSETMQLYQLAGINPLSGCVPMLLQMPILLSMFYFFPNMIELRQASFLWADDLSAYDSILDLPFSIPFYGNHVSLFTLLMTVSTIFYSISNMQMTNTPQHMKIVQYIMPVIFLFFLNAYSAALTYYYFLSNLVAMGQQSLIKRWINEDKIHEKLKENTKKNQGKTKGKFQQKLEEALKEQQRQKKAKTHSSS